jgi:hypothetical protein
MSYNYGPLAAKAVAMIAKYGKLVTLEMASSASPADAAKPWRGPDLVAAPITRTPKALEVSFEKNEIDGERIRTSDIKLLIAGQDPALAGFDIERVTFCTLNGKAYGATNLSPLMPGDTMMLYTLRLRQG